MVPSLYSASSATIVRLKYLLAFEALADSLCKLSLNDN